MRRLPVILVGALALIVLVYSSIFIVNEREQAVVLRFGEITRVIREPGVYFKIPTAFVDTVQKIEDRLLSFEVQDLRVLVRDGRRYVVDAFVAFRIVDPRKFRENVSGSLELARENMETQLNAALRRVYGQRSFEAALSEQRGEMMVEVRDQLRPLASTNGLEVVDVRIKRTDLLPEVSQQTFERMQAERLAEAAQLRARGTELAARIRAEADREAVVTVAGAEREAEILRGEGDAERSRIFADAYQRNPEFFEFYRSMRAYERALRTGTNLVLSPDSQFFRFFNSADGIGAAASGGQPPPPPVPAAAEALPAAPPLQTPPAVPAPPPRLQHLVPRQHRVLTMPLSPFRGLLRPNERGGRGGRAGARRGGALYALFPDVMKRTRRRCCKRRRYAAYPRGCIIRRRSRAGLAGARLTHSERRAVLSPGLRPICTVRMRRRRRWSLLQFLRGALRGALA
jgi:membrane protease subunit HflC